MYNYFTIDLHFSVPKSSWQGELISLLGTFICRNYLLRETISKRTKSASPPECIANSSNRPMAHVVRVDKIQKTFNLFTLTRPTLFFFGKFKLYQRLVQSVRLVKYVKEKELAEI